MMQQEAPNSLIWYRLHPLSLVYFSLHTLKQVVQSFFHAAPALVSIWFFVESFKAWLLTAGIGLGLFVLVFSLFSYLRFTYTVETDRIRIKYGVFKRVEINLAWSRIQQADIYIPWYFRLLRLRTVRLESAGSKGQEIHLAGLPTHLAQTIQNKVEQAETPVDAKDDVWVAPKHPAADIEIHIGTKELLKIGLLQNPLIFGAALLGFIASNNRVTDFLDGWVETYLGGFSSDLWAVLFVGGIFILLLIAVLFVSLLMMASLYFDYRLERWGQRYQYKAGLFNKLTRSFPVQKLQSVLFKQGVMGRLLNREQMEFSQAGVVGQRKEKFLIPILNDRLKKQISQDLQLPEQPKWQSYHFVFIRHFTLIGLVAAGFLIHYWASLVALVLIAALNFIRWRKSGWFVSGQWLGIRNGFIGHKERWLLVEKVQMVRMSQGPIQKALRVASLTIYGASGIYLLNDLPVKEAVSLKDYINQKVKISFKQWM